MSGTLLVYNLFPMLLMSARDFTLFNYFQMMSTNDAPSASTAVESGSNATDDVAALKLKIALLEAKVAARANAIPVFEKTIVGIIFHFIVTRKHAVK